MIRCQGFVKYQNGSRTKWLKSSRFAGKADIQLNPLFSAPVAPQLGISSAGTPKRLDSTNALGVMISAHESLEATLSLLVRWSLSRGSARIFTSALALFACARFHLFFGFLLPGISNSRPARSQRNSACRRISQGRSKFSRSFALLVCAHASVAR